MGSLKGIASCYQRWAAGKSQAAQTPSAGAGGGFFSCLVCGGQESDIALAGQSLLHLGIFPRREDAVVLLLLPDGWWLGRLEDLPVAHQD